MFDDENPDLQQYEGEITKLAQTLYEGGHSPDEASSIAWGYAQFLYDLGVI